MAEQNWFNVTTFALRDWTEAKERYFTAMHGARSDPQKIANAQAQITHARSEYRRRVLSWYRKLLLPMKLGDVVPNEVAELLAEEWDLGAPVPA